MIVYRDECDSQLLVKLLSASLDQEDESHVTTHLAHCETCQRELDNLTAPGAWWRDTQILLRDTSSLGNPTATGSRATVDPSVAWVVKLLKPATDTDSIGMLDDWPVREVIGQGGMGVVVKVWDEELHRPLAVKLLSPMLASNGAARQRFFREAQAAAAVVHPNIVPIYTVATDSVLPYLVMPFVAGGNLQQRIDREGSLPLSEILSIGVQIAEALVAAHRLGMVHRDIKPANILLDDGGHRVLLSDFGLARTIDDASLTNSGMVAGTPQFMSPEQASGLTIDHRSDLYSLGAVLYAMATGRPPVRGESTLAILRRVGEETPIAIYEINETMPLWMEHLVHRFLEKKVESRVANATDAVELLRSALSHARAPGRNPLPKSLVPSPRNTWLQKGIASGLLMALGAMGFLNWPANRPGLTSHPSNIPSAGSISATNRSEAKSIDTTMHFDSGIPDRLMQLESNLRALRASMGLEPAAKPAMEPIPYAVSNEYDSDFKMER